MLYFVGLGLSDPSGAAEKAMAESDCIYLEQFTSMIGGRLLSRLKDAFGSRLQEVKRWQVEDGSEILRRARSGTVALASYGDPMIATTHIELRARAAQEGIKTRVIHGASAITAMIGECGLHYYKAGQIVTVMGDAGLAPTPYRTIYKNLLNGNHSVLLLEYDQEKGFFLEPGAALGMLEDQEKSQKRGVITDDTYVIVASRIGEDQRIAAGNLSSIRGMEHGSPPHSIIVPGTMHFTESDALKALAECADEPHGNAQQSIAAQMLERYYPMILKDAEDKRIRRTGETERILENARLYAQDARRFLEEGQDELAVLSIGYADGLVDAVRTASGIEPD